MAEDQARKRAGCGTWAIGLVLAAIVLVLLFAMLADSPAPQGEELAQAEAAAVPVAAGDLAQAFRDNEVAAEARFGGKPLLVTGAIALIGLNDAQEPYLALDGADVMVLLDRDAAAAVAGLANGDEVTALCTERLAMEGVLRLDGCVLRPAPPSGT